jgi:hypothetical protein
MSKYDARRAQMFFLTLRVQALLTVALVLQETPKRR